MSEETVGELYDSLPFDEWVFRPEYGLRFKKVTPPPEADQSNPCCSCPDSIICVQEVGDGCLAGCECGCGEER